jgi:hypothetical protein
VKWWWSLCALAAINITAWMLATGAVDPEQARWQILLSGVYVFGCAYRSVFPVYDIPRLCVVNSRVSSVLVGRTVATLAELAFAAQWAVYLYSSELDQVRMVAITIVPLIAVAQTCCWHAVLTTRNLGHVFENSLWGIAATIIVISLLSTTVQWPAGRNLLYGAWVVGGALYVAYIFIFDVPMYWSRWKADQAQGRKYLSPAQGVADMFRRSQVSLRWLDWRSEVTWMTLYFSFGVWTSISLVLASVRP